MTVGKPFGDHVYAAERLRRFAADCFQAVGVPREHAETVADDLIDADLRGVDSHGVSRLIRIYVERLEAGIVDGAARPMVVRESPATALVDARNGLGAVAGTFATDLVIRKAAEVGSAWVGVTHGNHFGACAYYTNRIAERGMVGIAFTNAPPTMAPWGGVEPYLGTNPIGVSVPARSGAPVSVDLATSVAARGHILLAATKGEPIPSGWAQDRSGRPTTDAKEALAGSVLPMAGHKGYALAFIIDVLSGILTGSAFGRHIGHLYGELERPQDVGYLLGAIDISRLVPLDEFQERLERMMREIKAVALAEWADRIFVPGEPEALKREQRMREGIRVAGAIRQELIELGERLAVPFD